MNQPSLQSAIFGTYAVEGDLIEDGASERSIVFHIAARLERYVELWGGPWRVDTRRKHLCRRAIQDYESMCLVHLIALLDGRRLT